MRAVARIFAVAILCVGTAHAQESKWPEVVGVRPTPESLTKHHTDKFRIDSGFAIRRGTSFELTITTNEVLTEGNMTIVMVNDDKPTRFFPEWNSKIKEKLGTKQYLLEVSTPVDSPVGKYENIEFVVAKVDEKGHWERTHESYTYQYPFPIYVLFDPWNPKDEAVYVADESIIKDTLLNEYGKVFDGSLNSHRTIHWYYGHFYQVALDAVFHILEKAEGKIMHDAYEVAKFISRNVGVAESSGKLKGNKDGVLRGRWETTFPGGRDPDDWVSTYDILKEWQKTGEPAKYGQCWVFAATQNTLLRAIGFASRQLSCFGARIDRSDQNDPNKVKHHIVREYYDDAAKLVYSEGSVWNYHSWNDVHINRKDKAYSGWQGIDGTPPGLGFAPLKAVYNQEDDYPWDTDQLISTTHSRVERFLIKCKDEPPAGEKRKSLEGCKVIKQLSVDKAGVQLMLSSADDASGEKDITKEYVDASRDAYIPEKPRPHYLPQQEEEAPAPYVVHVEPQQPRLPVGQPVEALVSVQFQEPMDGSPALDVSVALDLVDRTGSIIKEVHLSEGKMLVDSEGRGELTLQIAPSEYVHVDLRDKFLELRAIVKDPVTGHVAMQKRTIPLDGPQLRVMAPPLVAAAGDEEPEQHSIAVHLENPHPFPLDEVCVTIHPAASLQLGGDRTHCTSVGPNEFITVTKHILAPEEEGTHTVTLTVAGSYLPSTIHHLPIVATEPRTGMAHYRN